MTTLRKGCLGQRLTATTALLLAGLLPAGALAETAQAAGARVAGPQAVSTQVVGTGAVGTGPAGAADAAAELAQRGRPVAFEIPAQDLNGAVLAFAEASGVQVFYDTARFEGVTTNPVSGELAPEEALRRMLLGTGVTFTFEGDGSVTLERPTAAQGLMLSPLTVEAASPLDPGTSEGTGSYTVPFTTVGSKLPVPMREIPQSVSVVTRQRIEDQNAVQLEDALKRTTGITVLQNDQGRSSIFSRGYELSDYRINGLPAPLSSVYGTQPNLAMFDRVELLRGPTGLFGGAGDPAGSVNLIRKRALEDFQVSGTAGYGSWDHYRAEADATGPLIESGRLRGRVVGSYLDRDSFIDENHINDWLGYATLEGEVTEDTTLALSLSHEQKDIVPQNGLPSWADGELLDVDRSTFSGADWNRFENTTQDLLAELQHRFDSGGELNAGLRYAVAHADFKYAYTIGGVSRATGTAPMRALAREYHEHALSADVNLSQPFELLGQEQWVVAGVDYRRYEQDTKQGIANGFATFDAFDPDYDLPEPATPFTSHTVTTPREVGTYAQLRLKPVEWLTVIPGGRLSWYEATTENKVSGSESRQTENAQFTPYLGLVADVTGNVSLYASYTDIFQPQSQLTSSGEPVEPRVGTQYEAGVKAEFYDGLLNASVGVFQIDDENRAQPIVGTGFFGASEEVRIRGVDAELAGTILPNWEAFAGYSFMVSEYVGDSTSEGDTFNTWTPKHTFKFWTKYSFDRGFADGLWLGAGGTIQSSFYAESGGVRLEQDGVAVLDAQIGYEIVDGVAASLTVNNITDETYYTRLGAPSTFNFYGEPRSFWFDVSAKF